MVCKRRKNDIVSSVSYLLRTLGLLLVSVLSYSLYRPSHSVSESLVLVRPETTRLFGFDYVKQDEPCQCATFETIYM